MKKELLQIEGKEKESKKVIVEIGPGARPLIWRMARTDTEASYGTGEESLFKIKPGDTFIEVDLPPERSIDVFRRHIRGQEKNFPRDRIFRNGASDSVSGFAPFFASGSVHYFQ